MPDGAGGFFLFLFESFAARALLGSLFAALAVEWLLRHDLVRSVVGRRLLLLVPFGAAGVLAVASANRGYLPNVWIDTDRIVGAGALLDVLGDPQIVGGSVDLLIAGYVAIVGVLLIRRTMGVFAARRMRQESPFAGPEVRRRGLYLALRSGITPPEIRLRANCAGGAFTTGIRRPWIALDPALATTLDAEELDALLAHEIAHIRRRDPLLTLLTGLCRDLAFFLPGIHLAVLWLRKEQEETADDLAAASTRRPGALASTILKVWEAQVGRPHVINACAAVAPALRTPWQPLMFRRSLRAQEPHAVVRVQRLISPLQTVAHRPSRRDLGVPLTVLTVAVALGVVIPAWLTQVFDNDGVLLRVFATPPAATAESPAFATFQAMAPTSGSTTATPATRTVRDDRLCPCVETAAQLRAGTSAAATTTASPLVWSGDGRDAWELQRLHAQARLTVEHELISFRGGQREVGFFTVSRTPPQVR